MPPLRKLRIGALDDLARQLRFAPPETLRHQLERAEALAADIDPAVNYPEDWVVFKVTGYRPDIESPAIVVGEALLGDISALVERLSAAARVSERDLPAGQYLDSAALEKRWSVSRKTVDRYRLRGLIARRVASERSISRLMFPLAAVERFEKQWGDTIKEAAGFTRMTPELEAIMIRRAGVYRRRLGCTLNQAAKRIADRYGRAHETIRQLLRRNELESPIFAEQGPPAERDRRLIGRAWWWSIEPARIARHLSRTPASIQRVIVDERAARLQGLTLDSIKPDSRGTPLTSDHCTRNFGRPGITDLLQWVQDARAGGPPAAPAERARAAGYHTLIGRASAAIVGLSKHGNSATVVDRIETDLRWAARLKAELVRSELPLIVRTLESSIHRPLEEIKAAALSPILLQMIRAVADAVDGFDPAKSGRLASPAGLAVTRLAARFAKELETAPRSRAVPRLTSGTEIPDWTLRIAPWQSLDGNFWLEPHPRIRALLPTLDARAARILELRFGWNGPPQTTEEVAAALSLPPMRIAAMERKALAPKGRAP